MCLLHRWHPQGCSVADMSTPAWSLQATCMSPGHSLGTSSPEWPFKSLVLNDCFSYWIPLPLELLGCNFMAHLPVSSLASALDLILSINFSATTLIHLVTVQALPPTTFSRTAWINAGPGWFIPALSFHQTIWWATLPFDWVLYVENRHHLERLFEKAELVLLV